MNHLQNMFGIFIMLSVPLSPSFASAFQLSKNQEIRDLLLTQGLVDERNYSQEKTDKIMNQFYSKELLIEITEDVMDILKIIRDTGNTSILNKDNMEKLNIIHNSVLNYFSTFNNVTLKAFKNKIKFNNLSLSGKITQTDKLNIQNSFKERINKELFLKLKNERTCILTADFLMNELNHIKNLCNIIENNFNS